MKNTDFRNMESTDTCNSVSMNEDKKNEITRYYFDLLEMQRRLHLMVRNAGLSVELENGLSEPDSVDQLAEVMNIVRSNMAVVASALNVLDRSVNGCETRTRESVMEDIDRDLARLTQGSFDGNRHPQAVELNIAYDRMQLRRV